MYALVDSNNVVVNLIVYNGTDLYTPSEGLRLVEVAEDANIGDVIS